METDQNITETFSRLKLACEYISPILTDYEQAQVKLGRVHMLEVFKNWMQEDLIRLGLINNTK